MSIISGTVSEIYQGTVKSGRSEGSPFWSVTLSTGNKLSTFDAEHVQDLEKGKEYTFDIETKGQFVNIVGVPSSVIQLDDENLVASPYEEKDSTNVPLPNVTSSEGSERTYKNRISALSAAVQYVGACMGGTASDVDMTEYFLYFLEMIETGRKPNWKI